jgi:hypothetical protein
MPGAARLYMLDLERRSLAYSASNQPVSVPELYA